MVVELLWLELVWIVNWRAGFKFSLGIFSDHVFSDENQVQIKMYEDVKEPTNGDTPKNNPQYTTVYVGNLAPECSWVSKPTPPGTTSNPLPPPVPAPILSPADLFAYERQLAWSKMALMHLKTQHPFKHANTNRAAVGASQAIYDGWFPECRCDVSLHGYVVSSLMDTAY
ncbi:hypothetical protein Tco_1367867 [Tanacetum coccineum]